MKSGMLLTVMSPCEAPGVSQNKWY